MPARPGKVAKPRMVAKPGLVGAKPGKVAKPGMAAKPAMAAKSVMWSPGAPAAPAAPAAPTSLSATNLAGQPPSNPLTDEKHGIGANGGMFGKPDFTKAAIQVTAQDQGVVGTKAPNYGAADPRDDEYWRNLAIITGNLNEGLASIGQRGSSATDPGSGQYALAWKDYQRDTKDMNEARETGRKSLARSMIGTGLLRSGYQQMRQDEGDSELLTGLSRVGDEYQSELAGYDTQRGALERQARMDESDAFAAAVARRNAAAIENVATGDPINKPPEQTIFPNGKGTAKPNATSKQKGSSAGTAKGTGGVAPPSKPSKSLKQFNSRIKRLQKRIKNAKSPKKKKQLRKTLQKVRKNKNTLYGKRN